MNRTYTHKLQDEDALLGALQPFEAKLNGDHASGKPTEYDVKVNDLCVIKRTSDPKRLFGLLDSINPATARSVELRLFSGNSMHHDRHVFSLDPKRHQTLSGVDVQEMIERERREWERKGLEERLDDLKREHAELQEYADRIEEELKGYRGKRLHLGNIDLVEIGGAFLEGFLRRNPQVVSMLPGGQALSGLLSEPATQTQATGGGAAEEGTVRRSGGGMTEQEREFIRLLRQVEARFTHNQFAEVLGLIDRLAERPEFIPLAIEAVTPRP